MCVYACVYIYFLYSFIYQWMLVMNFEIIKLLIYTYVHVHTQIHICIHFHPYMCTHNAYTHTLPHTQWNINHKKEWTLDICDKICGSRGYYAKWSKSGKDKSASPFLLIFLIFHLILSPRNHSKSVHRFLPHSFYSCVILHLPMCYSLFNQYSVHSRIFKKILT